MNAKEIQSNLNLLNIGLTIDGVIGDKTLFWIYGIQYAGNLKTDGIYGPLTNAYVISICGKNDIDTAHFKQYEFNCYHCDSNIGISIELLILLEAIRYHFKRVIAITSGYRCTIHNKNVGGVFNSTHTFGKAADIVVSGVQPLVVYDLVNANNQNGGVGKYNSFTHVDVRGYKSRW